MSSEARLRFAPSPTGWLHVGNARTAMYNWLQACKEEGVLILRIEDTDQERSQRDFEQAIMEDLAWLGIRWHEGPDRGGPFGPYRQSERVHIYRQHAEQLLLKGAAYRCYCTDEELAASRAEAKAGRLPPRYDGRCRNLSASMQRELEAEGRRPSIRFRAEESVITVNDRIRGDVSFPPGFAGDFVILRSDGLPTYNFAAVVDDALMQVTDVIRGEDHLSNTPRQIMLYNALGYPIPRFAHHALLLGPDGSRLSKRHGSTAVRQYREEGYVPEALANYLALLGWEPEDGAQVMDMADLIRHFHITKVQAGSAVFDRNKLTWLNSRHIRAALPEALAHKIEPFLEKVGFSLRSMDASTQAAIAAAVQENIQTLADAAVHAAAFFKLPDLNQEAREILSLPESRGALTAFRREVEHFSRSQRLDPASFINSVREKTGLKGKQLFMPLRAALTGAVRGPELQVMLGILTPQEIMRRIDRVLDAL